MHSDKTVDHKIVTHYKKDIKLPTNELYPVVTNKIESLLYINYNYLRYSTLLYPGM